MQKTTEDQITNQKAVKKANDYITKLLKKRIWTGEETGKVYLYDFIRVTETRDNTRTKQHEQIITKTKIAQSRPNFDKRTYRLYVQLFNWLLKAQSTAFAYSNMFLTNRTKVFCIVETACNAEPIGQELEKQSLLESNNVQGYLQKLTLDRFIESSNKSCVEEIAFVNKSLLGMKEAWKETTLFSNTLKEVGNRIDIKEMIVFEADLLTAVKQLIEALHKKTLDLRQLIANGSYKNTCTKEQKLKVIDEVFAKANVSDLDTKQADATKLDENKHFFEGIIIANRINPKFEKT
jgi:hypothetical protein